MKIYMDSEFVDDGKTIDLISIGLVSEDGREIYLQSVEFDPSKASQWVKDNVLSHLPLCPHANVTTDSRQPYVQDIHYHNRRGQCTFERPAKGITGLSGVKMSGGFLIGAHADCFWRTREQMRSEIIAFCDPEKYGKPEFIGWCCSYDHVAFCQLFGTMIMLPVGYPHYFKDLQNALDERGIPDSSLPEQEGTAHNALSDAKYIKLVWEAVVNPLYRSEWSLKE